MGKPTGSTSETRIDLTDPGVESSPSGLMNPQGEDSMSETYQSLSHSKWDCKYHVVFVTKRRRNAIFGQTRRQLGAIFHGLARQKECQIIEGHLMPDHVHMCIAIPPKHPVASGIGFR